MTETLYETLGLTTDEIATHSRPHTVTLSYLEQPDGDPIVGLTYTCDYDATEEYGIGDLRAAITSSDPRRFTMTDSAARHFAEFSNVNGFTLSTRANRTTPVVWDDDADYATKWNRETDFIAENNDLRYKTVPELRQSAKDRGISPIPRTRNDLLATLRAHRHALHARTAHQWPAWFRYGTTLIVRCDAGPATATRHLINAAHRGTLGIGTASGPFCTGILFYDTDEETQALRTEREAHFDWHDARMSELEPIAHQLRLDGYPMYFLGRPTHFAGQDDTRYWMNSGVGGKLERQIYGWFTLEQIANRTFVDIFDSQKTGKTA
ncbi:hypothetical protein [Gordonia sihwensis]|uniref:hypothetical protein n=1 Tax=Gordonia sihwensis TaxID=173559 RepID=UPI003D9565C2